MKALHAGVSGVILPGACVNIESEEIITVPTGHVGVMGIRQSLFKKRIILGANLAPSDYTGKLNIQLINHGDETIEVKKGDELVNLAYLLSYME